MFKFIEKYLMGPLTSLSQLKFVRAIQTAGMALVSVAIVGSSFLILAILPEVFPFLQGFYAGTLDRITDLYMLAQMASIGFGALYFVTSASLEYTRLKAEEDGVDVAPLQGMLVSMYSFFILIPELVRGPEGIHRVHDPEGWIVNGWSIGSGPARFNATGIFMAIIVTWFAVNVYTWFIKKDIRIKLPDSVPDGVANSFSALIPVLAITLILLTLNGILIANGTDFFGIIAIPFGFIRNIANSWIGMVVVLFCMHALWIVGIHGAVIINAVTGPFYSYNFEMNVNQGGNFPIAGDFFAGFAMNGGSGATLGLVIMMAFLAKSEHYKYLGRATLVPGIFQINEPIIFGLPMVYNPHFTIPFILSPIVGATLGYIAISLRLVRPVVAGIAWPMPAGFNAFLMTGGDWKAGLLSIGIVILQALIYYPFFRIKDNELYREQLAVESNVPVDEVVLDVNDNVLYEKNEDSSANTTTTKVETIDKEAKDTVTYESKETLFNEKDDDYTE